jgi:hypothetical protein
MNTAEPIPVAARSKAWVLRPLAGWDLNPARSMKSVSCECCVLSGRGPCVGPITRTEESYRVWCVWVWSRNLNNEEVCPSRGCTVMAINKYIRNTAKNSRLVWYRIFFCSGALLKFTAYRYIPLPTNQRLTYGNKYTYQFFVYRDCLFIATLESRGGIMNQFKVQVLTVWSAV